MTIFTYFVTTFVADASVSRALVILPTRSTVRVLLGEKKKLSHNRDDDGDVPKKLSIAAAVAAAAAAVGRKTKGILLIGFSIKQ